MPELSPTKPVPVSSAKPASKNLSSKKFFGTDKASLVVPIFDEVTKISSIDSLPRLIGSLTRLPPKRIQPGLVSITVLSLAEPNSNAANAVRGFIVDPGS